MLLISVEPVRFTDSCLASYLKGLCNYHHIVLEQSHPYGEIVFD